MTTLASSASPAAPTTNRTMLKVSFGGVLRSEWIKFRSVRSTAWLLIFTLVAMVGTSALIAVSMRALLKLSEPGEMDFGGPAGGEAFDMGIVTVTSGYQMGQLVLTVLAILIVTSEFSTGRIRSTLVAAPGRSAVLWAKALLVVIVSFVVATVSTAIQFGVSLLILSGTDMVPSLGPDDALRQLLGVPLYLSALCLLAFGIGVIVRSTPGAIAIVMGVMLVLPVIGALVNLDWVQTIATYLPTTAGALILAPSGLSGDLTPWQGYGVLLAWALGATLVGAVLWRSRDA